MHHRKTHRHRKSRKSRKSRNMLKKTLNKTLNTSVSVVKTTSKKYMPKVKTGLENVGSKVIKTGQDSVPYLQQLTRKVFSKFGVGTKKNRKA